jgi:hypothetical protein
VDLRFLNGALQKLCNSRAALVKQWGAATASVVAQRLHELDAMDCLGDVGDLSYVRITVADGGDQLHVGDTDGVVVILVPDGVTATEEAETWRECTAAMISDVIINNEHGR